MSKITYLTVLAWLLFVPFCFAGGQAISGKTADDIITNARYLLNQEDVSGVTPFCTDAEMIVWTDEGQKDIVAKAQCLKARATIDLATSTFEYSWSGVSDYIKIDRCFYYDGTNYKRLIKSCESVGHVTAKGSPDYWCELGDKVLVWPVPIAAYSGTTVFAYYVPMPSAITATTTAIEIPAIYDKALTFFVAAQASLKDGQTAKYAALMGLYEKELDRYRVDIVEKPKESILGTEPK